MQLSSDILSQFAKVTKDETTTKQETIVYGTIVESNDEKYVRIDGSDLLTPMASTTNMSDGERVTVMIKNHMAVVTGNVTSPAVRDGDVDNKVSEVRTLIADKADIKDLNATNAEIEKLKAGSITVDKLEATNAEITKLQAKDAEIERLVAGKATVEQLEAERAEIDDLIAKKANIDDLNATYANIDFTNIGKAAMEYFYATSGLIKDVVVDNGTITGNLVGVTIKGDLIEGNTVVAEKLVIKGNDGLYYKLNTDGMKVEAEQTDYNSLNGSIITAKSITATKISVSDLVAFDATIGGFNITDSAIYSGVKESVGNTTRGIYLDKTGQFAFGDSNNFLKFYKDSNGAYKLEISAASIKMGTSGTNVETAINNVKNSVDNIQIGGRNYILGTAEPYTAVGTGSRHWLFPWHCASVDAANSLFGKTVTISFDCDVAITSGEFHIHIGTLWWGVRRFDSGTPSGHFTWTRAIDAATVTDDVFIYIDGTWTGSVTFSNMKVEIGNKETDWSPAPEDTDAAIAKATAATLEITEESITSSVKTINTRIDGVVETTNTALGKKVDSSYLLANYSTVKQTDDKIKTEVGKVVVGGRNYVLGTVEPYTATGTGSRLVLHAWKCASKTVLQGLFGKEVTVSFDYEENITSGSFQVLTGYTYQGIKTFDSNSGSGHLSKTFTLNNGTAGADVILYIDGIWTGSVTFRNVKLELGNKETDWSPAPEDVDTELDEVRTAVQEITPEYIVQEVRKSDAYKNDLSSLKVSSNEIIATVTSSDTYKDTINTLQTQIKANSDGILLQAAKTVGGRNYILGTGTPYTAVGNGSRQWLYPWSCASPEAVNRLFGNTVTISFDYDAAITSGSLLVQTNILWWGIKSFAVGTESGHFTLTRKYDAASTNDNTFIYLDGTWTGTVTFSNVKVEIGDVATDWTPAPEEFRAGSNVEITEKRVKIISPETTIGIPSADGETMVAQFDENGLTAKYVNASNVTPRYSGFATLYVNPNATSAQIAKGDTFRSLADALATLNGRWIGYNVTINLAAGMVEYGSLSLVGVSGGCWITIQGNSSNPAKLVGGLYVYHGSSPVSVKYLNIDATGDRGIHAEGGGQMVQILNCKLTGRGSGYGICSFRGACVEVENCEVYDFSRSLYGHNCGLLTGYNCKGNIQVGANHSTIYLRGTMPSDSPTWAYAASWAGQVIATSITVDQGSKPTPLPNPTTATYNYTRSDSYRGGWSYFDTDAPRQGFNGMDIYGTIWFDAAAIRSALSGKTIKQASLRLFMVAGVGRGRSVVVQLYGTNMGYDGRSGRPELTTSYGTIGTTEPDMNNEMTIPTSVISDIVSGRIQALVLKSDDTVEYKDKFYSENYARFEGSTSATTADNCPRLTVVYQ